MGLFDDFARFVVGEDINEGMRIYKRTPGAVLVDVRDAEEFRTGHIAGAVNIPLKDLAKTELPKNTPLFVYCLTGMRSRRGVTILKKSGFTNVRDIGAMNAYEGKKER